MPKEITGRDNYIIARALYLAIDYIDSLPAEERPLSDQEDMQKILNERFPGLEATLIAAKMQHPPNEDRRPPPFTGARPVVTIPVLIRSAPCSRVSGIYHQHQSEDYCSNTNMIREI